MSEVTVWLSMLLWSLPLFLISFMTYGYLRYKLKFRESTKTQLIILQITTVGNKTPVERIVRAIRDYSLSLPHKIWVVTETDDQYEGADLVIKVPKEFKSISKYKARALDYSSQLRKSMGLSDEEVKVLYLDDDTIPSWQYIKDCFFGDYDIMEGILQPKVIYGSRYSYVENMRTLSCMSVCSVFQSHGHPVWCHGEGLCVRADAEQRIKWQFDVIASEDLCFGHKAAKLKESWGFSWQPIYITSPLNIHDYFKQRNRWIWGNIHAIAHILPARSSARLVAFYVIGSACLVFSTYFAITDLLSGIYFDPLQRTITYVSLSVWLSLYGFVGYTIGRKAKFVLLSMGLAWFATIMNTIPIWFALVNGKPKKFEVIRKI